MTTLADLLIEIGIDAKGVDKGAREVESKLKKNWDGLSSMAAVGGAAVGVALMAGVMTGLDSEAATDKLAASLGAEGKEAENLGRTAGNLYVQGFGESMDQVATAVGAVTSSFDNMAAGGGVEKLTERVLNMAKAFELDVPRAAQVAGQAVKSGLAKNGAEALDLLTYSMQRVPAAVRGDLLDAVDEYGPFLSGIGIKGEQAFGLLVKSAEKGMYGIDKTGDALKEFTIRATDMSAASKVGFDALGMSQEEMAGKLLKGGETGKQAFDQIIAGLNGIKDPVKQSQAALALFGTPLEDLSVQEIPKFLSGLQGAAAGMDDAAGAADRMGATLNDNAKSKLEAFKRKAQEALVDQLAKAIPYIEKTFGWLQKNSDWVVPLATGLGILAVAIGVIVAVQAAWNAVLALSPVTWIVLGILALVAVIVLVATKTKFFQTIWQAVWGFLKAIGAWFAGPFANFFKAAWGMIVGAFNSAKAKVMMVINALKIAFMAYWNLYSKIIGFIISKAMAMVNFFKSVPGKIKGALSGMFNGLWTGFKSVANKLIRGWNNLSFKLGGGSVMGINIPSITLNTPDIPYLKKGGIVPATPGGMLIGAGEGGEREVVAPLSKLPQLMGRSERPIVVQIVPGGEREFRRWINKTVRVSGALRTSKPSVADTFRSARAGSF